MPHTPAEQVFWHHQAQPTEASGTSDPNHPQQQFVILQLDNSGQQHQQTATLPHMSGGYLAGLATRTFFFCSLSAKNHWFGWRANQRPLIKETLFLFCFSQQLPCLRLGPFRAFWADTTPFKGPQLASFNCFRNYKDTRTSLGVPQAHQARRSQDTIKINATKLHWALVENTLFTPILDDEKLR